MVASKEDNPDLPKDLRRAVLEGIVEIQAARRLAHIRRENADESDVPSYKPILLNEPPDPEMTFETMIPFRINSFATDVAKVISEDGGARALYNPLYCYAEVGLGKTHLLSAIALASRRRALLVNAADFSAELTRAVRLDCKGDLRAWVIGHDLFLVDDVQLCEGNEDLQQELFAIINQMMKLRRSVVFSSDVPPMQLRGIESRLTSRLGGGPIVALNIGDRDERERLLERFVGPGALPQPVIAHLAEHVKDNVRRLKAAAVQVLAMSRATGVTADVDMARVVVPLPEDLARNAERRPKGTKGSGKPADLVDGDRYKQMLANAETEEEQVLALQIALSERLRQLKERGAEDEVVSKLQTALGLLRDGKLKEALQWID